MFSHGARVGMAVSGGKDSVCLLDVMSKLAPLWDLHVVVLHVNHRLRPESDEEETFVRNLADRYGVEFFVNHPVLEAGNLEQSARRARLRFFQASECDRVATGHTMTDQAETVLFRILRGTGTTGLAAIRPVAGKLVRPLIDSQRSDIDEWVRHHGLDFREDSSNADARFARNRIRHHLMPQLEAEWNPALTRSLASLAAIASDEDAYLDSQLPEVASEPDGSVVLEWALIQSLDPALRRRLVRKAIGQAKGDLSRIELPHVESVLALKDGHDRVILPGVDVLRSFEWIRFTVYGGPVDEERYWVLQARPGFDGEIPGGHRISIGLHQPECRYNEGVWRVPAGSDGLTLRNWRPGDRIRWDDASEAVSIKQLFQRERIPLWERRNWPVLESREGIVWAGEFGARVIGPSESGIYMKLSRRGIAYRPLVNQNPVFQRL